MSKQLQWLRDNRQNQIQWLRNNRALCGAILVTVLMAVLIFCGKMQAGRAAIALSFCWVLALHSMDMNDHKEEVLRTSLEIAEAGQAFRAGKEEECVQDLQAAAGGVKEIVADVHASEAQAGKMAE